MIALGDELASASDAGVLPADAAARLIAVEHRDVFSLFGELRAASYLAVALITTGAGLVIKNNADRIGPMAIMAALLVAAAGCYAWAARKPARSIVDDYVLLLGALLFGAAAGYAESQYHMLGANWSRHFLFLAALHVAVAYFFDSRLVLSAALTSLAAWFGIDRTLATSASFGTRALLCAALIALFRAANRHRPFHDVYEHFAANLAFWGALSWAFDTNRRWAGVVVALAVAALAMWRGLRGGGEAFVVYAVVYATIAVDVAVVSLLDDSALAFLYLVVSTPAAIVVLFVVYRRLKERAA